MRTLIFPAKFKNLDEMRQFAAQAARDAGMDEESVCAVELAIDEACSNIIEHAYGEEDNGEIECICSPADDRLTVILRDHGKPFDASRVPPPDLVSGVDERRLGGLGVYLMRQLMDEVRFESLGEAGNLLTMIKFKGKKGMK
jgi:serine/threonine-protein kinase RsbW